MMPLVAALAGFAVDLLTVQQSTRLCNRPWRSLASLAGTTFGLLIRPEIDAADCLGMICSAHWRVSLPPSTGRALRGPES